MDERPNGLCLDAKSDNANAKDDSESRREFRQMNVGPFNLLEALVPPSMYSFEYEWQHF